MRTGKPFNAIRASGRSVGQLGLSRNTVKKYVTELEQKHLITTELTTVCTKGGRRHNGSLLYTIRPIEEAKEYYFEQQLQCAEKESLQHKTRELLEQRRQEQTRKVV